MTIAISLKINDGLVLAADSASTMTQILPGVPQAQQRVVNVYNNANKIFNLVKRLPIGAITWGSGSIGAASIATIVKDLRDRLRGKDPTHPDWKIDRENYQIQHVAKQLRRFVYEELYTPAYEKWTNQHKPAMGFIVGGYSKEKGFVSSFAEEHLIQIDQSGNCEEPKLLRTKDAAGATWSGEPEALNRLISGFGTRLPEALAASGLGHQQILQAMMHAQNLLQAHLIIPAMPLQDAIDLAEFMVETTIKWSRFSPGVPTVGGPIEIAAISKHEGFRWVKRKYYFSRDLNPTEDFDVHTRTRELKHAEDCDVSTSS